MKIVAVQAATKQLQVFLPPKVLLVRSCKAHYKDTPFGLGRVSPTAKNPTPPVTKSSPYSPYSPYSSKLSSRKCALVPRAASPALATSAAGPHAHTSGWPLLVRLIRLSYRFASLRLAYWTNASSQTSPVVLKGYCLCVKGL